MASKQQARPEDLIQIIEAVEDTIHVKIPGVFPRWFLEHQGHKLKVWEAIVPAPLYGAPIVCDGVYYTQEAAAHGLLSRIAHMESLLRPFFPPSKAKSKLQLPSSLRWLYPMGFESRMRFVAAVKNSLQHRRVTRDGLILASVLRWQEDRGLMLIDPSLAQNIADSYYSTNSLGVIAARPPAAVPEPLGSSQPSSTATAKTRSRSQKKKRNSKGGRSSSASRQHLARGQGAAVAGAGGAEPHAGHATTPSLSGSSMAENESMIDILDPEAGLKEHRAALSRLAAGAGLDISMSTDGSDAFQAPTANFGVSLDSDEDL